jgi:hypothetical protein
MACVRPHDTFMSFRWNYLGVFFARSSSSRQAGQEALQRMYAWTEDRDAATTWATREAQSDAVCTWGIPDHARARAASSRVAAAARAAAAAAGSWSIRADCPLPS